ncbi:sugar transferase [Roseomonas populi]|uniref:Sugar transferase n=1 Tax=Roseomonas populi TaxID=3121582 RepID=A0ABT1XBL6_9PROT|nr:sugar transferase [Roseomonas pecuniae]MCR0985104.1 sugar transferase [Roseomonas pecuniae]
MTSVFGHDVRSDLLVLYLAETGAVFLAVYALALLGVAQDTRINTLDAGLVAVAVALCCGVVVGASGLYRPEVLSRARRIAAGGFVAALLLLILTWLGLQFLTPARDPFSWSMVGAVLLGSVLGVAVARVGCSTATRCGLLTRRLLVLQDAPPGLPAGREAEAVRDFLVPVFMPIDAVGDGALTPEWLKAQRIWAVVAEPSSLTCTMRERFRAAGLRILSPDELDECRLNRVVPERLPENWLLTARGAHSSRFGQFLHRCLDIAAASFILLATLPVWVVAAVLVRLDSPGPILYRQVRVGLHGKHFTLYKFRSMVVDAEAGGAPRWATRNDPRVTRLGRFMRLTRIDELPQLINVLRGEMAIVGPRPERPGFVEQLGRLIPHYDDRALVKPGITGWAQVNYPYGASVEDARMKLAYDLYYVRRRSLFLDLVVLVSTVRVVLFQEGAR